MLSRKLILPAIAVALIVAASAGAGEMAWWDRENCAMCKNISPGLMESMDWEQHTISNGFVAVTTVKKDHLEAYRAAHDAIMETGTRMSQGEKLELCGSCNALGACMMKDAQQEYVKTKRGDVWIVTSDDPEVVADLHAWVKRNQEEMEKYSKKEG